MVTITQKVADMTDGGSTGRFPSMRTTDADGTHYANDMKLTAGTVLIRVHVRPPSPTASENEPIVTDALPDALRRLAALDVATRRLYFQARLTVTEILRRPDLSAEDVNRVQTLAALVDDQWHVVNEPFMREHNERASKLIERIL